MILEEQIISLLFSLIYGIIASLIVTLNYKIIFNEHTIIKVIASFLIVFIITFGFYCGLLFINCGVIHPYFLILLLLGYCLGSVNFKRCKVKKVSS